MTPRAEEQELIKAGAAAVLAGRSLYGLAADWTASGIVPVTWHPPLVVQYKPNTVKGILTNNRLAGLLPDGTPATWEPVLDEATWLGVKAVLTDPSRRGSRAGGVKLLSGIAMCARCLRTINASGRAGEYRCTENRCFVRKQAPVDDYVGDVVVAYLAANAVTSQPQAGSGGAELAGRAAGLRARLAELEEAASDPDGPSPKLLAAAERKLTAELTEVEAELAATASTSALAGLPLGEDDLAAVWEAADTERRRSILKALPIKIKVHAPGRGARVFDPETVTVTGV